MKTFSGEPSAQREDELEGFIAYLKANDVTSYLEIGARYGDSFHEVALSLPVGSTVVAIDMVDGYWGRSNSAASLIKAVEDLTVRGYDAHVLFGNSACQSLRMRLLSKSLKFDAILIDGDHRLEGATLDWINYSPMANKLVAFHDIDGAAHFEKRSGAPVDVPQIWQALKKRFKHTEIIGQERGMGIGILHVEN